MKDFSQYSDLELVEELLNNNHDAIIWFFFTKARPLLEAMKRKIFKESTLEEKVSYKEFVDDLYVHLMGDGGRNLRTFSGSGSLLNWTKKTVFNHFIRDRKNIVIDCSNEPEGEDPVGEDPDPVSDPDRLMCKRDVEVLMKELAKKNPTQAQVLTMLALDGMTYEEVAQKMGYTVKNVYNIKHRAMAALIRMVQGER